LSSRAPFVLAMSSAAAAAKEETKTRGTEMTRRAVGSTTPPLTRVTAIADAVGPYLPRELLAIVHAFCTESLFLYFSYRVSSGAFTRVINYESELGQTGQHVVVQRTADIDGHLDGIDPAIVTVGEVGQQIARKQLGPLAVATAVVMHRGRVLKDSLTLEQAAPALVAAMRAESEGGGTRGLVTVMCRVGSH
jgi:hypothetical protein